MSDLKVRPPKEKEFLSDTVNRALPRAIPARSYIAIATGRYREGNSGIIGTRNWVCKEERCPFPTIGRCGLSGGNVCLEECLAEAERSGRSFVRHAERWWELRRSAATSAGRACSFRWRRGARDCRNFSAGMHR